MVFCVSSWYVFRSRRSNCVLGPSTFHGIAHKIYQLFLLGEEHILSTLGPKDSTVWKQWKQGVYIVLTKWIPFILLGQVHSNLYSCWYGLLWNLYRFSKICCFVGCYCCYLICPHYHILRTFLVSIDTTTLLHHKSSVHFFTKHTPDFFRLCCSFCPVWSGMD